MPGILDTLRAYALRYLGTPDSSRPAPATDLIEYAASLLSDDSVGKSITAARLQAVMDAAATGSCYEQASLFSTVLDREPVIAAHLGTRRLAVAGTNWTLTSKSDTKRAEALSQELRDAGLDGLVWALSDYAGYGYAGAVVDWAPGAKAVLGFRPIPPESWEFDLGGNPALLSAGGTLPKPVASFPAGQVVYVLSRATAGLPCRSGLLRALLWTWLFKHTAWGNWARFVEKFGIPFVNGKIADQVFKDDRVAVSNFVARLKRLGKDGVVVGPLSSAIELVSGATSDSSGAFETFHRYCDEVICLLILGQLATAKEGSGLSNGGMQESVREDIRAADCRAIANAIQRQVIAPRCRYGWGTDPGDLTFWLDYEPVEDLDKLATTWKTLTEVTGRKLEVAPVEVKFGVKFSDEPTTPPPAPNQPPPGKGDAQLVDLSDAPESAAIAGIAAEALRRTVADPQTLAEWLGPVTAAVRDALAGLDPATVTPDELRAKLAEMDGKLPGLFDEMDSTAFERNLQGAMFAAALNGYTGLTD